MTKRHDSDEQKGVVEQESPHGESQGQPSLSGQLEHRTDNTELKDNDTDFPEPGAREEHSGERQG